MSSTMGSNLRSSGSTGDTPRTHGTRTSGGVGAVEPPAPELSSTAGVLGLIRSGRATSRAELARTTGLSATTVAQRVDALIRAGYVREAGMGDSRGGRRPRSLEVDPSMGVVCAVDLGSRHANVGLLDLGGRLLGTRSETIDIATGVDAILEQVTVVARRLQDEVAPAQRLRGYGIGLPGPVDEAGVLVSPSRMPGWNGANVAAAMTALSGLPTVVDNDANLMALGEHELTGGVRHMVVVKAGSSIGCGVIASGDLHRGHHGLAGDISHASVPDAPDVLCSCGRTRCLDAVAGGSAIVRALRDAGVEVEDVRDVIALARDAHPLATQMLREAGTRVGHVLATIMNFFNPQRLVLGGILSESDAFVAGARSAIYLDCLPMITDRLDIVASVAKDRAGVLGAGKLVLDRVLDVSATSLPAS